MSRTKIALISGAAVGLTAFSASAQNPNMDAERAYGAELLANADARTSLLQAGGSAGYSEGDGFGISSADGNYSLNVDAFITFNYTINSGAETGTAPNDRENGNGFHNDDSFIAFHGNAINQDTHYKIKLQLNDDGTIGLTDMYVAYQMENGAAVGAGQFYVPLFWSEFGVAEDKQLTANKALGLEAFGASRTQGVAVKYGQDQFQFIGAITDGYRAANTAAFTEASDFAVTVRGDFFGAGSASDFKHGSSFQGSEQAWRVGGGFHFETGGETQGTSDTDTTAFGVDAQFKDDGWNAGAGFGFINVDPSSGTEQETTFAYAEGGYFFTPQLEGFGRYDYVNVDNSALAEDTFNSLTFGVNYFFVEGSYAARFIADVTVFLQEIDGGGNSAALLGSETGLIATAEDSQVVVKGQLNLAF